MKKCICNKCPRRFHCFTNKKVFSEPILQSLFESYLGEFSVEDALRHIRIFLEETYSKEVKVSGGVVNIDNAIKVMRGLRR